MAHGTGQTTARTKRSKPKLDDRTNPSPRSPHVTCSSVSLRKPYHRSSASPSPRSPARACQHAHKSPWHHRRTSRTSGTTPVLPPSSAPPSTLALLLADDRPTARALTICQPVAGHLGREGWERDGAGRHDRRLPGSRDDVRATRNRNEARCVPDEGRDIPVLTCDAQSPADVLPPAQRAARPP